MEVYMYVCMYVCMYMKVMDGLVLFGFGSDSGVNWIPIREVALLPLDLLALTRIRSSHITLLYLVGLLL